jgi:hypothetical protein
VTDDGGVGATGGEPVSGITSGRSPIRLRYSAVYRPTVLTSSTLEVDPADTPAAFAEYAATGRGEWVAAHLTQLFGLSAMVVAGVILAFALPDRRRVWARVTALLGTATVAAAAVLQAVDGVGLKAMVDRWAGAPAESRSTLYAAAMAVREIEIGLDALVSILGGLAVLVFATALLAERVRWPGLFGLASGAATVLAGVLFGLGGYSTAAMVASMASGLAWLGWGVLVAAWAWRRAPQRSGAATPVRP